MEKEKNLLAQAKKELSFFAKEIDDLKVKCDGKPRSEEQRKACENFFNKMQQYIDKGLDRGNVYDILKFLYVNFEYTDEFYEYETSITGHCSSLLCRRFQNEPKECLDGSEALYEYIHSLQWKHE